MRAAGLDAGRSPHLDGHMDVAEDRIDMAVRFTRVTVLRRGRRALDDVTFEIPRGCMAALLGPPGAGKSTAIEVGLAVRRLDSGVVRLLGLEPRVAIAAGRVGAMLSSTGLPSGARVDELLRFVRALHRAPLPVDDLIDRAGLESLLGRSTDRLSDGQAQQLRFALALAGDPDLLLLDDPDAGLRPEARTALWANMERLKEEGRTILVATRNGEDATSTADRILLFDRGRLAGEEDLGATRPRPAAPGGGGTGDRPPVNPAPAAAPERP